MTHASVEQSGWSVAGLWLRGGVMGVVGAAGLLKAMDLPVFLDTVETWSLLGPVTRWSAVVAIPPAEMVLSVAWFAGLGRFRVEAATAALLVVFGAVYGLHLLLAEPPSCGCFGLVDEYFKGLSEGRGALWRNGLMLAALLAGRRLSSTGARSASVGRGVPRGRTVRHAVL